MPDIPPGTVIGGYTFLELLGHETLATVYRVRGVRGTEYFARVGTLDSGSGRSYSSFLREGRSLLRLNHPNVVRLFGHFIEDNRVFLILEFFPNWSVHDYVERSGPVNVAMLERLVCELCAAATYCWSLGVAHGNITPRNVFFDSSWHLKLCNFGATATEGERGGPDSWKPVYAFYGDEDFAAPEVSKTGKWDGKAADCWSIGATCLYAATGKMPWLKKGDWEADMEPKVAMIVAKMMRRNPMEREMPRQWEMRRMIVPKVEKIRSVSHERPVERVRAGNGRPVMSPVIPRQASFGDIHMVERTGVKRSGRGKVNGRVSGRVEEVE